jgi:hypothetical protein
MSYLNRHASTKKSAGSAELMYLVIVLAAGIATAWWAGHRIGMDLSSLTTAASMLGLTDTGRQAHGAVGYTPRPDVAQANEAVAPYCATGQAPSFSPSALGLQQQIGAVMGSPVECEHAVSVSGDTVQQTTAGLVAYKQATNTTSFTDGWRHYAVTSGGLATWEGPESDPPRD